ncbi:MAG: hypothetical protein WCC00_12445 [Candidatus Aminicenantales bacterium]
MEARDKSAVLGPGAPAGCMTWGPTPLAEGDDRVIYAKYFR